MSVRLFAAAALCLFAVAPAFSQTCTSVTLSSYSASVTSAGTGNATFDAFGNPTNCARTAVSNNTDWLTLFTTGGTSNPVTIGYTVRANTTTARRTGTISVNGGLATFTVVQDGITCTYSLSPSSVSVSGTGGSGSISVTTQSSCSWSAGSSASWLTVSGSGSGNGTINYEAAANSTTSQRTATITAGTASITVTQAAACSFTLSPGAATTNSASTTATFTITANNSSCTRTAASDSDWLTISSGQSGTGSGSVSYSVGANNNPQSRTGRITVGDAVFILTQLGANCVYTASPATRTVAASGGPGSFSLTTTCTWNAVSTDTWLKLVAPTSGTGNATISYVVDPNPAANRRTASITAGTAVFTISQDAASCSLTISQSSLSAPAEGASGSFDVDATSGCNWTATSSVDWVTVTAGSGNGPGRVSYTVAANATAQGRTGSIGVGNQVFTITQSAANCAITLDPASVSAPVTGASGTFAVRTVCGWTASSNATWLTLPGQTSGTGNGQVDYVIAANPSAQSRTAAVRVGAASFNVTQAGGSCTLTITPTTATAPADASTGRISVTGTAGCEWDAVSNSPAWLTITGVSRLGTGSGSVDYSVAANKTFSGRTATITIGTTNFNLTQVAGKPTLASNGIVNSASFQRVSLAPGMLVTLFGSLLGPSEIATLQLTPDNRSVTNQLAQTRVLFDGTPSPMIYSLEGQVSAVVPYNVSGKQNVGVTVEYQGIESNSVSMPVAATAPAIFTQNSSGTGAGAVLNQDFSLNTAQNAAARNSVIQIFATGAGNVNPVQTDGILTTTLATTVAQTRVFINGIEATVTYAGSAPTLVSGVLQVNARIPQNAPVGAAIPITLRVGNIDSPAGVTISVR